MQSGSMGRDAGDGRRDAEVAEEAQEGAGVQRGQSAFHSVGMLLTSVPSRSNTRAAALEQGDD